MYKLFKNFMTILFNHNGAILKKRFGIFPIHKKELEKSL